MTRLESLRRGAWPVLLYGLLALLSFPTFGHLVAGEHGVAYALDVFELPRTGVQGDWLANGLTLWNTHLTGGNALFAQQSNNPFAIDVALAFVVGPFAAYVMYVWLMAALAGLSMHLFLRDSLRLSTFAVLAGAIVYVFGFWQYIYGLAGPAIPLLFWLMDRAVAPGPRRWRYVLAGSLIGALVLYHALSQVVLIVAVVQLAYLLVTAADRREIRSRFMVWGATWILALGLYGPVFVTQLVMLPISVRTVWDLLAFYDPTPVQAVTDTLVHYSQALFGVPVGAGVGASPARYGTYFLGAIVLPFLVLGIVGVRRDRRGWFLLALLLAIPAWDLVAVLLAPVQQQLGFLKSFQMDRIRHLFPFALVANAALGMDLLARTVLVGRPLQIGGRWRWAVVGASLIPLGIALAVAARQVVRRRHDLLGLETPALGWALLFVALAVGLACLVLLAITAIHARHGPGRAIGATLVVGLLLALTGERAAYAWGERLTDTQAYLGTWAETLGVTPAKSFLLQQPGIDIDRVLSFGGQPNQLAAAGMLQVDGYQSIYPMTYHAFFGALIAPALAESAWHTIYYGKWGNRVITFGPKVDPELVALSGARWLYVLGPDVPTVPGIVARFQDGAATVYEVPSVLPRVFVAGGIDVRSDPADVVAGLAAADLDALRGSAFVVAGDAADRLRGALAAGAASPGPAGSATITSYTPDRVVVDVRADRPGVLVLTDVMAPGWVAERDGSAVPIATVDATFRGVAVDTTTRQVVFRYVPLFTYAGFALAGIALVLSIAWALAVRRRDRDHDQAAIRSRSGPS